MPLVQEKHDKEISAQDVLRQTSEQKAHALEKNLAESKAEIGRLNVGTLICLTFSELILNLLSRI